MRRVCLVALVLILSRFAVCQTTETLKGVLVIPGDSPGWIQVTRGDTLTEWQPSDGEVYTVLSQLLSDEYGLDNFQARTDDTLKVETPGRLTVEIMMIVTLIVTIAAQLFVTRWTIRNQKSINQENRSHQDDLQDKALTAQKENHKDSNDFKESMANQTADLQRTIALEGRRAQLLHEARIAIADSAKTLVNSISDLYTWTRIKTTDPTYSSEDGSFWKSHVALAEALENWDSVFFAYANLLRYIVPAHRGIADAASSILVKSKTLSTEEFEEWASDVARLRAVVCQYGAVVPAWIANDIVPKEDWIDPLTATAELEGSRLYRNEYGNIDVIFAESKDRN